MTASITPSQGQLFDVSDLYRGPNYSRLADELDLAYPDISPQTLVENFIEAQGDPDAVWTVIYDIKEVGNALAFIAQKAALLATASDELRSRIEELEEADKEMLSTADFSRLLLGTANNLRCYSKGFTKYKAKEALEEVTSWFDSKVAQLLQEVE